MSSIFEKFSQITIPVWITLGLLIIFSLVVLLTQRKAKWSVLSLCVGAMCIALAFILSYIRLYKMPQGGSITLASMLPICLFAYLFGWRKGLLCGIAYGFLQLLQDFYILHPLQVLIDYPMAFGLLGLAGLFSRIDDIPWAFPAGTLLGAFGRWCMHTLSGVVFFGEFAEGNPWIYSMVYNASYMIPETLICIVLGTLLISMGIGKRLRAQIASR